MLAYLRYALATVCFALSVACLGLWWRSFDRSDLLIGPIGNQPRLLYLLSSRGIAVIETMPISSRRRAPVRWRHLSNQQPEKSSKMQGRQFRTNPLGVSFPIWYPALVCALAGIAALRLGRRFTLRSAIIATTIVAGLLGMVAAL